MKTIQELNQQLWYRALKSIYILTILGILFFGIYWFFEASKFEIDTHGGVVIAIVVMESLRHVFYYIFLGKVFPPK